MGRDTLALPKANAPIGRVGGGLDRSEPGRSGRTVPVRQPRLLDAANMASARWQSKLRSPRNPSRPGEDSGARERRAEPRPSLPPATPPARNASRAAAGKANGA